MPSRDRRRQSVIAGVALMFVCVLLFGVAAVLAGTERHSYVGGALPPNLVSVRDAHAYQISVHGGVQALGQRHITPGALQCEWSSPNAGSQLLNITAEKADTKATNLIATFVAPVTGSIHVECIGWGPVFVDDADNASPDYAGLFLVLGVIVFLIGLILLVHSPLRRRDRSGRTLSEDEEIERLVHLVQVRSQDGEVADVDRPDRAP